MNKCDFCEKCHPIGNDFNYGKIAEAKCCVGKDKGVEMYCKEAIATMLKFAALQGGSAKPVDLQKPELLE